MFVSRISSPNGSREPRVSYKRGPLKHSVCNGTTALSERMGRDSGHGGEDDGVFDGDVTDAHGNGKYTGRVRFVSLRSSPKQPTLR
jgi:hypothetical protein